MTSATHPQNPLPEPAVESADTPRRISRLMRRAVLCNLLGLAGVLLFLLVGFNAWTVAAGIFAGIPLLIAGIVLYAVGVFRDLRRRGVL